MSTTEHESHGQRNMATHPEPLAGRAPNRPNFVVVMTDDQGPWARSDLTPELVLPNLARLVARGRDFTRGFCASPVCSPARASVLTGRMPSAHGVHDWLRTGVAEHPPWAYLEGLTTTPMLLAEAGYRCGHVGKWHLGHAQHPAPGFADWAMVHQRGGGPYFSAPVWIDGQPTTADGYLTTLINDNAATVLSDMLAGNDPFYLQVHHTAPHTPWGAEHHPREYLKLYDDCDFPSLPREPTHPWFRKGDGHSDLDRAAVDPLPGLRGYAASLTAVDDGLGRLLDLLDQHGRGRDTYLIFLSDNGFNCGHHGIWGKGNGTRPLNMYEESVRVPFLVAGPNVAAGTDESLISSAGLFATIADLAGITPPQDPLRAAGSFASRLTPEPGASAGDGFVTVYDEYGGARMIRTERFKYVNRYDGPDELYDLIDDPGERTNLVDDADRKALRDDLHLELAGWFAAHVEPDRDAFTRPVTGYGQNTPVWTDDPDETRYA